MSAILAARKSESNLNGPRFDPEVAGVAWTRAVAWLRTLFAGDPRRNLPARLLRDAGLATVPGGSGRMWADADRRRRLPL